MFDRTPIEPPRRPTGIACNVVHISATGLYASFTWPAPRLKTANEVNLTHSGGRTGAMVDANTLGGRRLYARPSVHRHEVLVVAERLRRGEERGKQIKSVRSRSRSHKPFEVRIDGSYWRVCHCKWATVNKGCAISARQDLCVQAAECKRPRRGTPEVQTSLGAEYF